MSDESDGVGLAEVEQNFATNVREYREQLGLSQEELAQRMAERGFGFTQATVWKIEQGKRAVRIAEAVALMDALGLPSWMNLTRSPHAFRRDAQLQAAHRRAGAAFAAIKDAAADFLRAQDEVAVVAHEAREAGVAVNSLDLLARELAERAVIEARIAYDREDAIHQDLHDTVSTIMAAIRASGYEPVINLDEMKTVGTDSPASTTHG